MALFVQIDLHQDFIRFFGNALQGVGPAQQIVTDVMHYTVWAGYGDMPWTCMKMADALL
jgi:hypothetical protein